MVFDLEILRTQLNRDDRLTLRLLQVFETESHADEARLRIAVAADDRERVCSLAHKLTGSLGEIGATNARQAAHEVGGVAQEGNAQALATALARFDAEITRVHQEIEKLLTQGL